MCGRFRIGVLLWRQGIAVKHNAVLPTWYLSIG